MKLETQNKRTELVNSADKTCPDCGKEFQNGWGLRVHIARAHQNKPKQAVVKRKYTKRIPVTGGAEINYCPNCSCNLGLIRAALNFQSKLS